METELKIKTQTLETTLRGIAATVEKVAKDFPEMTLQEFAPIFKETIEEQL